MTATSYNQEDTQTIYFVGGSKGGVGKSIVSMATIDYLLQAGKKIVLIDTDTSNADVYKTYKNKLIEGKQRFAFNLDESDGWIDLLNLCDQTESLGATVVINTAARNNVAVEKYGKALNNGLARLKNNRYQLVTLWVINRQRDSIQLLQDYRKVMTNSTTHVVKNLYFGESNKFELYDQSKTRAEIEQNGGLTLEFPDLADRVTQEIYNKRLTIEQGVNELPIGSAVELERWREVAHQELAKVLNPQQFSSSTSPAQTTEPELQLQAAGAKERKK